jgi:osmotically inducible lipoprotein OsmB
MGRAHGGPERKMKTEGERARMIRKLIVPLLLGSLALGLTGCGNSPGMRALTGGAIGAGAGAGIAAVSGGKPATGALIGGAVGAVGGAVTAP